MTAYKAYSSPHPSLAYSPQFFSNLTFGSVLDLDYPTIVPSNSLLSFVFEGDIPFTAASTLILPGEVIPHIDDVLKISNAMSAAFAEGKRSVFVQFLLDSPPKKYHFSKVKHCILGSTPLMFNIYRSCSSRRSTTSKVL